MKIIYFSFFIFLYISGDVFSQNGMTVQVVHRFISEFGQKGNGPGQFYEPSGITMDLSGNLYVADTGNDRVQKFNSDGEYLTEAGVFGWDTGQFNHPIGISAGKSLRVFVADSGNRRIQVFDLHLRLLAVVGGEDMNSSVSLGALGGITVSSDDEIYLSDTEMDQVVQINFYSQTDWNFGGFGYGSGSLRRPLGIDVDGEGRSYVCDSQNDRIAIFDRFGNFKKELGKGSLSEPAGVCLGPEQTLFVADTGHHRVLVFDLQNGEVVWRIGGPEIGVGPVAFNSPKAVLIGQNGSIYILDTGNCRVQKLKVLVIRLGKGKAE